MASGFPRTEVRKYLLCVKST